MLKNNSVRPEDVLADGVDSMAINGEVVRKGTIAAFLANVDILESSTATEKQKVEATNTMRELASAVITIGLHKHVFFKNSEVEKILTEAKK